MIGGTIQCLLVGAGSGNHSDRPADTEILVVCNGCRDNTAELAGAFPGIRVLQTPVPSKTKAINMGLRAARGADVICMDADIRLTPGSLAQLSAALGRPGVLAAAPAVRMDFAHDTSWAVRAYYRLWLWLPYVNEGMLGAGVYALNPGGRERIGELPDLIADDGFVRASFAPGERVKVDAAVSLVRAPRSLRDLIKIKTRSRLGGYQLDQRYGGGLPGQTERRQHTSAWRRLLGRPDLWLCVPAYLYVNLLSRWRARRQFRAMASYVWERDESSRSPSGAAG